MQQHKMLLWQQATKAALPLPLIPIVEILHDQDIL